MQSALLEAMQEKQVTIGEQSFQLPEACFVLATQNPLDQEGTYPLPAAQLDHLHDEGGHGLPKYGRTSVFSLNRCYPPAAAAAAAQRKPSMAALTMPPA